MTLAVVDDDVDVRTALNRLLRAMGHEVRLFASAEEFAAMAIELRLPHPGYPAPWFERTGVARTDARSRPSACRSCSSRVTEITFLGDDCRRPTFQHCASRSTKTRLVAALSSVALELSSVTVGHPPFEQLGRHLIDGSSDCVKLLDLDGRVVYLNSAGVELLELCCTEDLDRPRLGGSLGG